MKRKVATLRTSARLQAQRDAAARVTEGVTRVKEDTTRVNESVEHEAMLVPSKWKPVFRVCGWCEKPTSYCCPECEDWYDEEVETSDGPVTIDGHALCRPCFRANGLCTACWFEIQANSRNLD